MNLELVLVLCLLVPLAAVPLIAVSDRNPDFREGIAIAAGVVLFLLVSTLWTAVSNGARPSVHLLEPIPGIPLALSVEPIGMIFAFVASFLWIVTTIYSIGYMRGHGEQNQTRFYMCFAVAIFSAMGVAFSANMFSLFVFYEILTLSTYPLVTHSGTDEARRAGRVYLGILLGTSVGFQLVAIIWIWAVAGTLDYTLGGILAGKADGELLMVLYALFVFGVGKAAIMPVHRWLPAAMVAPTPVSALLHAVAVVKAGVFTVLKTTVYIFGIDTLSAVGATDFIIYLAAATILIASLIAMRRDNLKARLAYSTVSQLSYILLGAMLANAWGVVGGGLHIVMHAFGKITLFFCAGAIMVAAHKTEISQLDGLGKKMPLTMLAFTLGSLCIIGAPPLGGMWSKWYLAVGALEADKLVLLGVLMLSSILNVVYLLEVPRRAFFSKQAPQSQAAPEGHVGGHSSDQGTALYEAPLPCLIALMFTALASVFLFFTPDPFFDLLTQVTGSLS